MKQIFGADTNENKEESLARTKAGTQFKDKLRPASSHNARESGHRAQVLLLCLSPFVDIISLRSGPPAESFPGWDFIRLGSALPSPLRGAGLAADRTERGRPGALAPPQPLSTRVPRERQKAGTSAAPHRRARAGSGPWSPRPARSAGGLQGVGSRAREGSSQSGCPHRGTESETRDYLPSRKQGRPWPTRQPQLETLSHPG